jgi:uncharacterized membrane protein
VTKPIVLATLGALFVFLALDFVWLSTAAEIIYRPRLGAMLAENPDLGAALLFYLLYLAGLNIFVLRPALADGSRGVLRGAAFGLVAYGIYDLTNQATLANWPWTITIIDMAWGAVLTGVSCAAGLWFARKVGK